MIKILILTTVTLLMAVGAVSAQPNELWNQQYGGDAHDEAMQVVQMPDGGYTMAGYTFSIGAGAADFYLVRTDANGDEVWARTFGGVSTDFCTALVLTTDGGFALAGYTYNYGAGNLDFWLVKTDENGQNPWYRTFGGAMYEYCNSLIQTADGGFALAGKTNTFGAGQGDFWLVLTDANGDNPTYHTFGDGSSQECLSLKQTTDGGFVLAGMSDASGSYDVWMVKTDANGDFSWDRTFGSNLPEIAFSVIQTADGGFALAGYVQFAGNDGGLDAYLITTDANGQNAVEQTFGGAATDWLKSIIQTSDGGLAMAGISNSANVGNYQAMLIQTDSNGDNSVISEYGAAGAEDIYSIIQTADGGLALAGKTDVDGNNDFWLLKLEGAEQEEDICETPPDVMWEQTYGGGDDEGAKSVVQTNDGGFALAGYKMPPNGGSSNYWLVRADTEGDQIWSETYQTSIDYCNSMIQTSDGGFALVGNSTPQGGYQRGRLVKTDANGDEEWSHIFYTNDRHLYLMSVIELDGGGYALGGLGSQGDASGQFLLIITDQNGGEISRQEFGDNGVGEHCYRLIQTSDGDIVMVGEKGNNDIMLIKVGNNGLIWDQVFGGQGSESGYDVIETSDGGLALIGSTDSYGAGGRDAWLIKTDANGNSLWDQTYGGQSNDQFTSVLELPNGGFVLAGSTSSFGAGLLDGWIVGTDANGNQVWDLTVGGQGYEGFRSLIQTSDGGFALCGSVLAQGANQANFWLVKLGPECAGEEQGNDGPHFDEFAQSDDSHSVVVSAANFNNSPIPTGWEIGVFTQDNLLGGGGVWTDGQQLGIAVWGDDTQTQGVIEGFVDGDDMNFRLWDNNANVEYPAVATVAQGSLMWAVDDMTQLSLDGYEIYTMEIELTNNWNLISINVVPSDLNLYAGDPGPEIIPMMAQFADHLVLMKDEDGHFYWPGVNYNNIPYWNLAEGYQVKVNQAMQGSWTGALIPPHTPVPIEQGWNIIAYYPTYKLGATDADYYVVSSILNNLIIAKNRAGEFMVPASNHSNMQPWRETQGYQIKVSAPVELIYPDNEPGTDAAEPLVEAGNVRWAEPEVTGVNMSVLISSIGGLNIQSGDQIAAFGANGAIVGVGTVQENGMCGLAVWGDDVSTKAIDGLQNGEVFSLRLWSADANAEFELEAKVSQGSLVYETDGMAAMTASTVVVAPEKFYLGQSYPNPFNSTTRIAFGLPTSARVNVSVFDMTGRLVATLADATFDAGSHAAVWNADAAPAGLYMVKMQAGSFSETRKLTLVK